MSVFWILSGHVSKTEQDCFVLRTFSCFIRLAVSRVKQRNTSTALYVYTCTYPFLYRFCLLYFWRWYYNRNFKSIFVSFLSMFSSATPKAKFHVSHIKCSCSHFIFTIFILENKISNLFFVTISS